MGGDSTTIETNYFGKGDTTTYDRDTWPAVSDPQNEWHTYKVSWQKDAITWYIDGASVRTLAYADAQGGARFPQTPMRIRIGVWAGGDPSNGQGTIEWAGGETDYSQAPFSMYVKSVEINNANPAESYTYTDTTGSMDSIKKSGAAALSQTDSSSTTSTSSTSTSTSSTETTTTEPTTLATTTQSSSAASTTMGSSSAGSSSAGSSTAGSTTGSETTSGSSSSSTDSGSGSGSSSGSGSGSGTSTTGTGSSAASGSSGAATPSSTYNAAVNVATNYLGPISLLALVTAFIQL